MNSFTWHVKLVLDNDYELQEVTDCLTTHVMNKIYHDYEGNAYTDQKKARIFRLADFLKNFVIGYTDAEHESERYDAITAELILVAIGEVEWTKIAEEYIDGYYHKSPNEVAESEEFFEVMGFSNYDIDED